LTPDEDVHTITWPARIDGRRHEEPPTMNRRPTTRTAFKAFVFVAATILVIACTTKPAAAPSAATLTVQEQINATKAGLDASLAAYKAGDKTKADQLAGDAYLDHFEFVEGPLDEKDAELRHEIEGLIRDDLRAAIKAGKPAAEIESMVNEAKSKIDVAAQKLQ
jgi:hypothetical protein